MKERIAWIGGSHDRHLYYINHIAKNYEIAGGIMQIRENVLPEPPMGLTKEDYDNWVRHFTDRQEAEHKYFGTQPEPDIELLKVDKNTLNSKESVDFIKKVKPDIVLIFGSGMVREPLFSSLPEQTINLHLGLSPRYRGAATLFWPFYFQEPNFAGATFHYIVNTPDGGDIIHQVVPKLEEGDGIHDVGCKTVIQASIEAVALLDKFPNWVHFEQKPEAGKNFLEKDFKPEHLRMIYQVYDNDMVDAYLAGQLGNKEPKLFKQP